MRLPTLVVPPRTFMHTPPKWIWDLEKLNVSFGKGVPALQGQRIISVPRAVFPFGTFTQRLVPVRRIRLSRSKKSQRWFAVRLQAAMDRREPWAALSAATHMVPIAFHSTPVNRNRSCSKLSLQSQEM